MTYFPTDDQRMFAETAEAFAQHDVAPLADRMDREERTPSELVRRAAELGLFGLCIAPEYGGSGAGVTEACMVLERIARASPAFAGLLSVQMVLCPMTVAILGDEQQKQRLLTRAASGEGLMAYSQTEPSGAANVAAHQTKLTPAGNAWHLNGAKLFCTQGEANTYLVMCRTEVEGSSGYGCVIVEGGAHGFHVDPYEDKLGWRGTNTGGITFTDVLIEPDAILGNPLTAGGIDHHAANQASFLGHAATSLGAAQGLFDKTLVYVRERHLYGQQLARLSPISSWLAEIYTSIEAMRALLFTSSRLFDEGRGEFPMVGSVCKAQICESAYRCTDRLLQMWGGSGMINRTGVNRYFRDARVNVVAEATTEMHHAFITEWLLTGQSGI